MDGPVTPGLVSVVVASYNHAEYLSRRMDGLINQTYPNIEILVIDDCSPDHSVAVLRRYQSHPNVRLVLREKNGGWVTVSTQGVEMTFGEYVIFANCDDDCDPRMIERLVKSMEMNPGAGVAFCRSLMVDEQDQVMGDDFVIRERSFRQRCAADTLIPRREMSRYLLHSCIIPNLSAALIRRKCFDSVGALSHDYRACSDWDLFFRISDRFDCSYVAEPLNKFRQHKTTIRSATKGRVTHEEFFRLLLSQLKRIELNPLERCKFRYHVMYLWAVELIRPSISGAANFPYHFKQILSLDPASLFFLVPAIAGRIIELPVKAVRKLFLRAGGRMSAPMSVSEDLRSTWRSNIFHPTEWDNFIEACRRQPWHVPRYGFQISYLVFRRIMNKMRYRLAGDNHRAAKVRPGWLDNQKLDLERRESVRLCFPEFFTCDEVKNRAGGAPRTFFDQNHSDREWYFSRNRWGECLSALFDGEQSARTSFHVVLAWLGKALPKSDAAWEPYSSCERVVNLAVLLSTRPECRTEIDEQILRCFFEDSLLWIDGHLEYYGTRNTNNHILNNARALVVAGTVLQCVPAVERGLALFAQMARELFQGDGFLRERSSHYQVIVCNWLLDALHFARVVKLRSNTGIQALAELEALAERVTRATSVLFTCLGEANTQVGDISPDVHPSLSLKRLQYLYPSSITVLPDATIGRRDDWVFVSKNKHVLVACMAPHSYPVRYTTHGHSDLGGFVWLYKGIPILVDAGRSRYTSSPSSQFQSGPHGHNTILINGIGALAESLFLNACWCPEPYSRATVDVEVDLRSGFTLAHNGFGRIKGLGKHVRQVGIEDDGIVVVDSVEGVGTVILETLWHFPPQFSQAASGETTITGAEARVTAISTTSTGQEPDHQMADISICFGLR
mgnify:CR=1 FL=1